MPHHGSVHCRRVAGVDPDLQRASAASDLSAEPAERAQQLFGCDALLLVRGWHALLVQWL